MIEHRGAVPAAMLVAMLATGCHSGQEPTGAPPPVAPAANPVGLSAHVDGSKFQAGQPIPIALTVANQSPVTCGLVAMADTTVQVTRLTRDGQPVNPDFGTATYEVVVQQLQQDSVREVAPGQSIDLDDFGAQPEGRPGDLALTSFTAQTSGDAVAARFPMTQPGHYVIELQYLMPALPADTSARLCTGSSPATTVEVDIA